MQISFSQEEIQAIAVEIKKQLVPIILDEIKAQQGIPPLLTRKQFMELADISGTKCAELFNRADFPVNREFGHPRVPTALLFDWINENTDWVQTHSPKLRSIS